MYSRTESAARSQVSVAPEDIAVLRTVAATKLWTLKTAVGVAIRDLGARMLTPEDLAIAASATTSERPKPPRARTKRTTP